jgi:hypothetical protein
MLQAWVWCAITPISLLSVVVLWFETAPLDPLKDLAHSGLCDHVRGLHGDRAPLQSMERLLSHPAPAGLGRGSSGSGLGVYLYFHLPMFGPPDGWWKVWFFLRNDPDAPLLVFTGSRPIRQPNLGYGVVR